MRKGLAWNPNLRSRTAIRTSDTRYFSDPSLAAASLGIGPDDLISDMRTFGFIFENLCVRDLRVYAQMLNGDVMHYRDENNLECDAVIHLRNGKYGLIEVKLGGKTAIDQGAANLKKLSSLMDDEKMNRPSFLMVLTGLSSFAYRREDGVCRSGRLSDLLAVLSGKISMKFVLFGISVVLVQNMVSQYYL